MSFLSFLIILVSDKRSALTQKKAFARHNLMQAQYGLVIVVCSFDPTTERVEIKHFLSLTHKYTPDGCSLYTVRQPSKHVEG